MSETVEIPILHGTTQTMRLPADFLNAAALSAVGKRKCETARCDHAEIAPILGSLDQSSGTLPAAVYECLCGWRRIEPL